MQVRLIKTDADHETALARIDEIFDAEPGTVEGDELELLVHLVAEFESEHFPIAMPDPIEAVKFRMEQQGLKQVDLVPYIGNKSKVSEVLNRKRPLSLSMIRRLNNGLGIPAEVLMQEPGQTLSPLYDGIDWRKFPLAEMLQRQWFPEFDGRANDLCDRAEEILGPLLFPGGHDCREMDMAARRHVRKGSVPNEYALWAWQARVLQLSSAHSLGEYDPEAMTREMMRSVISLSCLDDGPIQARRLLEKSGIAIVILHYLPGTHLDGGAMVRPDGHPVIALTLRHDRLDNFWFTLAHEVAHVVLHLSKGDQSVFLDDFEAEQGRGPKEKEADQCAAELLIPEKEWKASKARREPTRSNILDLAVRRHVHPAIVAGRVRYERKNYKILAQMVGSRGVRKLFPAYKSGELAQP
jgi:HTH-type transcriptional regulator/antitoxin HigA